MDHTNLEIFRAVADELSITRAAKRLGRVPSNVTTRIQQLEEELGVALFTRDGNRLALSEEGRRFVAYADRLLALADEARQMLQPASPAGVLRLGTMESTAAARLPVPLSKYHQQWPDVQLKLSTATSRQLIESVRSGLVDCALAALPPCGDLSTPQDLEAIGLEAHAVFREELLLILPPGHRPVRKPGDIVLRSLIAFAPGCSYRALAEDWLGEARAPLDLQEVGSYHAMLAMVACGAGFCLAPRSVLELLREPPAFETRAISHIDTWLVSRRGFETAAFKAWREVLTSAPSSLPDPGRPSRSRAA